MLFGPSVLCSVRWFGTERGQHYYKLNLTSWIFYDINIAPALPSHQYCVHHMGPRCPLITWTSVYTTAVKRIHVLASRFTHLPTVFRICTWVYLCKLVVS